MIDEIRKLTDSYHKWLGDNTVLQTIEDSVEITVPFLDRHNDHLQIYAERSEGEFILSDDGYTIDDLELSGCNLDTETRTQLLNITLNGFGVRRIGNVLQVKATLESFALQKQNLLQAMLSVNDLHYTARPTVASMFAEDIAAWLTQSKVLYERNVEFTGKTGLKVRYDFVIPKNGIRPNLALWGIGNPNPESAKKTVFDWEDTQDARDDEYIPYAVLNDVNRSVSDNVITAFRNYGFRTETFSARVEASEWLKSA